MWFCYIDEAGDLGSLSQPPQRNEQPVFVLGGIFLEARHIRPLTKAYIALLRQCYPGRYRGSRRLDAITNPVKGAELRRQFLREGRNQRRHAVRVLDRAVTLLESCGARLAARCWIKAPGDPQNARSLYTFSVQSICATFNHFLMASGSSGVVLADARFKRENMSVSHSVFTQMYAAGGDHYENILESPSYGHAENHVGLQMCDLLLSALLFPIACAAYHDNLAGNIHVSRRALQLRQRFGPRLKALAYRYPDGPQRWKGGITVSDPIAKRSARLIFGP